MKAAKIALLLLLVPCYAFGIPDPGLPDTLRISSVSCLPGRTCDVPIYFYNDENLLGLEIVLSYKTEYLVIDSFSIAGGRLENYANPFANEFNYKDSLINYAFAVNFLSDDVIPPGNGLLGTLYFTANPIDNGVTFPIDTAIWPMEHGTYRSTVFAGEGNEAILPYVTKGMVTILDAPPSPDSVWVENVTGAPGQGVTVNVYGYNVNDISTVYLALKMSSTDLIYSSTSFTGTRGDIAFTKQATINGQELLISLFFDESSPLSPGSGPLARILFNIDIAADEGIVTIDSVTYFDVQPTQFILTAENGGLVYTPYFTAGQVEIKLATDVDDMETEILPTEFALKQNVPNPFNPTTRIFFELPRATDVQLDVFNILGQKVRTLVNEFLPAGKHEVFFDGRGDQYQILASGVYFYRIEAGEFRQSLKMTLMK
ncbi:MAG: T9SS type A sorting domain-containing protein [Candidatus Zixiibacteriota bacterium]